MTGRRRGERSQRGAAAVEFALVMVPLLYLVFGIINYGYMLAFRQSLSQATAEGAREAAVAPAALTSAQKVTRAQEAVNNSLANFGLTCNPTAGTLAKGGTTVANSVCTITGPATCSGSTTTASCMKVTIDYPYKASPLIPTFGIGVIMPAHLAYASEVQVN